MMDSAGLRHRVSEIPMPTTDLGEGVTAHVEEPHPAGEVKHGLGLQIVRGILVNSYFLVCILSIHVTQLIGAPLYFWNKDYYYAYMALTKQSFGLLVTTVTHWFSPTLIRVSWDPSLRGQIRKSTDGRLETSFPERMILISNHQIYTEWLYLWWIAYTSKMHGHIFIILKESLRYIPFLGPGMMFYGFIFMARKWVSDKPRIEHRLQKLKARHAGPLSGADAGELDPMWLLIFPEGTNLSANTRKRSLAWAQKQNIADTEQVLLPRATGLYFCLEQLKGTVDWVYDCTVAYEGVPTGGYAQDYFTLRSTCLQGRPPKSVNLYWRRFAVSDIPLGNQAEFEKWIEARWREKDDLMQQYYRTGRFPADVQGYSEGKRGEPGYINTEVKLKSLSELSQIFVVPATLILLIHIARRFLQAFLG